MARVIERKERVIRDEAFAKRLNQACDNHPHVPPLHYGRLSWVRNQLAERFDMSLSTETIRKWFAGEARPRYDKMRALAELIQTDEAWLSLGTVPELTVTEKKARVRAVEGAVAVVKGILELGNFSCAFPDDEDPRVEQIDFYAIIHGKQHAIKVCLAQEAGRFEYRLRVPHQHRSLTLVGVVQTAPVRFDLLQIKADLIDASGESKGGFIDVPLTSDGSTYLIGDTPVPLIRDFGKSY